MALLHMQVMFGIRVGISLAKKKKTRATSHSEHFIIHEEAHYRLHTRAEGGLKALEERKAVVGASFAHLLG